MSPTPAIPTVDDCVGRFSDTCTPTPELSEQGQHLTNLYAALEPGALPPAALHDPVLLDKLTSLGLLTEPAGFPWLTVSVSVLATLAVVAAVIGVWHLAHRAPAPVTEG